METKREMKRITAQAFNKKDLMFLWSKKARPFINFLVRHLVRLPRAVRKERIGTNISIRVSTYINKTKHF